LQTKLHSSGPHDPIRQHIVRAIASAKRVDAAVAFVTRAGVDLAHREIDTSRCGVRIVTSVRWPTNIKAVAELATRWPHAIWIHLAGDSPQEKSGDKYQMHSKAIAIEGPADAFTAFVGSHNWTFAALDGLNLEATVEVSCHTSDPFAVDLRSHIEACVGESEPFDPSQVDAYLAIQRALHSGPSSDSGDEFDDFDRYPAIVIHAEDPEGLAARPRLRLYVGPQGELADEFIHSRSVDLYLYPRGALLHPGRPLAMPMYFSGDITMVNTKADAAVEERMVDSAILDLAAPRIQNVSQFPDVPSATREVAMRLDNHGHRWPFVYHANPRQSRPTVRDRVLFEPAPIPGLPPVSADDARRYLRSPQMSGNELLREAPVSIRREIVVDVPSPDLYPEDPQAVLHERFQRPVQRVARPRSDLAPGGVYREEGEQFLIRAAPSEESRFVFRATHRSKR
jgi:HKD family nuclease